MTQGQVSAAVVADRMDWLRRMLACLRQLPLGDRKAFFADDRNPWAAESCLRRALEALLDVGRHILARGFAVAVTEYKQIARELERQGVLTAAEAELLAQLAGYRNRMVHFYHDVSGDELYGLCSQRLPDLDLIAQAYLRWLHAHPERVDQQL